MMPEDFTREDLLRIMGRDRFVKEQQAQRIASLVSENFELVAIIQELQNDLAEARGVLGEVAQAQQNQEVMTGGQLHAVADPAVPSG